jgi:hypothetical protein
MRRISTTIIELVAAYALVYFAIAGQLRADDQPSDPTGFVPMLNQERVKAGLPPVAYDPGIVAHAARNNQLQSAYGLGHHWLGGLAQCAGVGFADCRSVLGAWSMSPGHAAVLFSPSLVSVGYHQLGTNHTASCSMGYAVAVQAGPQGHYPVRRGLFRRCR